MTVHIATPPTVPGTRIAGLGHYRPDNVVTNDDLAQHIETNDAWIRSRVGIEERRYSSSDETVASMGASAGRAALADAFLLPSLSGAKDDDEDWQPAAFGHGAADQVDERGARWAVSGEKAEPLRIACQASHTR